MKNYTRITKCVLLILLSTFGCISSLAGPRSYAQAKAIAEKQAAKLGIQIDEDRSPACKAKSFGGETNSQTVSYYVFANSEDKGFVIVSGDDRFPEIIGYSDEGTFNENELPDGLTYFMKSYQATVDKVLGNDETTIRNLELEKNIRSSLNVIKVEPLLGNIAFGQDNPYNKMCPLYDGGSLHAVTGCVPVAMAQVMAYYRYPKTLQADIPGYNCRKGQMTSSISKGEAYDWANILPTYYNVSYTDTNADAVAKLLFHCGAAIQVQYGPLSGGNLEPSQLAKFFGYDADLLNKVYRSEVTLSQWVELINRELQAERPIIFSGFDSTGGHEFVCDGVDESGLYHINWGWNGSRNGYFDLMVLNPDYEGAASVSSKDGYTKNLEILIGIAPDNGVKDSPLFEHATSHINLMITSKVTWQKDTRTSCSDNFKGTMTFEFGNLSDKEFDGYVAVGVTQGDGNVIIVSDKKKLHLNKRKPSNYSGWNFELPFEYAFPVGVSKLSVFYSYDGRKWNEGVFHMSDLWRRGVVYVKATEQNIRVSKCLDLTADIVANDEVIQGDENVFQFSLHNKMFEEYMGKIDMYVSDNDVKPDSPKEHFNLSVPALGDITRAFKLRTNSENVYFWLVDEEGEELVCGKCIPTVAYENPSIVLIDAYSNATPGAYDVEHACYVEGNGLVKAPLAQDNKAVFNFVLKNKGSKARFKYVVSMTGKPNNRCKQVEKTIWMEANSTENCTVEVSPDEVGSRFIIGAITISSVAGVKLSSDVEKYKLYVVGSSLAYRMSGNELPVYVGGTSTMISMPHSENFQVLGGKGCLKIISDRERKMTIYNFGGQKMKEVLVDAGEQKVPIAPGLYIVLGKKIVVW